MTIKSSLKSKTRAEVQKESQREFKFLTLIIGLLIFGCLVLLNIPIVKAETLVPQTIRQSVVLDMPDGFDEDHQVQLTELEGVLRGAKNTDFTIRLSGLGGDIFLANDFIRSMEDSRTAGNRIFFDVVGIAASGHAYVVCYADGVRMRPGSSLLFHQVYGISSLFFGYVQIRELSNESIVNNMTDSYMQACLQNGRLTQQDIDTIKSGDDVILLSESGKIVKQYQADDMTIIGWTIPTLLGYLSNIIAVLLILGSVLYVWRRAGK